MQMEIVLFAERIKNRLKVNVFVLMDLLQTKEDYAFHAPQNLELSY